MDNVGHVAPIVDQHGQPMVDAATGQPLVATPVLGQQQILHSQVAIAGADGGLYTPITMSELLGPRSIFTTRHSKHLGTVMAFKTVTEKHDLIYITTPPPLPTLSILKTV